MIVPVILSGGSGTRLWPLSTPARPKQFLPLTGTLSLFEETIARVAGRPEYVAPIVVANAAHESLCLEALHGDPAACVILEPIARNTAVAIVMAAIVADELHGPEALLLVMPSDHRIGDAASFHGAVATGTHAADAGRLVTFGVTPTSPDTGYGYLKAGAALPNSPGAFDVAQFTEKPPLERAEAMVADGQHYWNGGIFLFSASTFLAEAKRLAPEIAQAGMQAIAQSDRDGARVRPSAAALQDCPDVSVDYAVMERSDRVAMVPLSADWSDVGSWDALAQLPAPLLEPGTVTMLSSNNCYVRTDGLKVSLLGVDDLIIVAAGDRVLIMQKGQSQNIRQLFVEANAKLPSSSTPSPIPENQYV